jgi:hypothetical protein
MANSAWLVLAVIAFNLLRAAGAFASQFHATVTTGTIRAQLISIPSRITRYARRIRLRLPAKRTARSPRAWASSRAPPCAHQQPGCRERE